MLPFATRPGAPTLGRSQEAVLPASQAPRPFSRAQVQADRNGSSFPTVPLGFTQPAPGLAYRAMPLLSLLMKPVHTPRDDSHPLLCHPHLSRSLASDVLFAHLLLDGELPMGVAMKAPVSS